MFVEDNTLLCVDNEDINSDGTFTFPEDIVAIGNYAFSNCTNLTALKIPDSVFAICTGAFLNCKNLKSIFIPDSIHYIGYLAFDGCENLKSAKGVYKAFNPGMTCLGYQFKVNKWSQNVREIGIRKCGYHYCTNLFEIFNFYHRTLDRDFVIYSCKTGYRTKKSDTSQCVTNKIKPIKQLTKKEVFKILNGEEI